MTIYDDDWSDTRGTSSEENTRLDTGRELDAATGLYYYRARWYDAGTGQFTTRDPLDRIPGEFRENSRYHERAGVSKKSTLGSV